MTSSRYGYKIVEPRVPVQKGTKWEPPRDNAGRVAVILDDPLLTQRSEQEEVQHSFLRFLQARSEAEFVKLPVRVQLRPAEYVQLLDAATHYNLAPATYAVFQLLGADPRGFFPGMRFAPALRRYTEQMHALEISKG